MASWRNSCSCVRHRSPTKPQSRPEAARTASSGALLLVVALAACGHAETKSPATPAATLDAAEALCRPADAGFLRARLQGAIDAEIDWSAPTTQQCIGGPRPSQDGLRLVYKGRIGGDPVLVIFGTGIGAQVTEGRNVPASVTVVREGAGEFYATQGDDKCALDEVRQEPVPGHDGRYRLSGRGYCTQPARAVGTGSGAVLVSRFDVDAVVEYPKER